MQGKLYESILETAGFFVLFFLQDAGLNYSVSLWKQILLLFVVQTELQRAALLLLTFAEFIVYLTSFQLG